MMRTSAAGLTVVLTILGLTSFAAAEDGRSATKAARSSEDSPGLAGRSAAEWRALLDSDVRVLRLSAVKALGELRQVNDLIALLSDSDAAVRHWAAFYLRFVPSSPETRARLREAVSDPDPVVRTTAGATLVWLGEDEGLETVIQALDHPQMGVVIWALTELRDLGPKAAPAKGAVRKLLKSNVNYYKRLAQQILLKLGEPIELVP